MRIAGCLPFYLFLELKCDLAVENVRRKSDMMNFNYTSNTYSLEEIDLNYQMEQAEKQDCIKLYTDGSKLNHQIGLFLLLLHKVVVYDNNFVKIHNSMCKLNNESTVFMAQLTDIQKNVIPKENAYLKYVGRLEKTEYYRTGRQNGWYLTNS